MTMKWFRRNAVGPPEWDDEAMGSVVLVQCATSAECIKSIDSNTVRSRSHYQVLVEMEDKPEIIKLVNKYVITRIW